MDVFEELIRERGAGRRCALATIVKVEGSVPSHSSARMLVREDGSIVGTVGGGAAEWQAIAMAKETMESGRSQMLSLSLKANPALEPGMVCGGNLDIFIEPIVPATVLYLFGAGHVGLMTARAASLVGLKVEVVDDRPEFANAERFPDAEAIHVGDLDAVTASLEPNARALVFIATRSHELDRQILAWALTKPGGYIGMIGSKRKVQTVFNQLRLEGFSVEDFARVHAPVGLEIGAATPEEIAVSVVAEMIAHLRGAEAARSLSRIMTDCALAEQRREERQKSKARSPSEPDEERAVA
ncbi:XdhC family protein [Consotaella salsifontis]|uniref:Xanthine dehydrogenase accessory factor n=1 Tax=Consotaella salsifontis TaxID=1365950 RepID=A0A1T4MHS0_9HYPH|nr:XdhC/CoxI family protein [Consotaella salsifontis]SJZ66417.1 xanthine dehydrogenase accessory factor [Consotaella salsifontis]